MPAYKVARFFEEIVGMMVAHGREYVYLHTDKTALEAWKTATNIDPLAPPVYWDRQAVLSTAVEPEHIGCQHLKAMVEGEGDYQVRAEITTTLIKSFYNIYLDPRHPLR